MHGMFKTEEDVYIIDEEAETSMKEEQKENEKALYNILDEEYINAKQITVENIKTKFKEVETISLNIEEMHEYEKSQNLSIYIVKRKHKRKKIRKNNRYKNYSKTR